MVLSSSFSCCWYQLEMPTLLFPPTSVWFNGSGSLISDEINTLPNMQIMVWCARNDDEDHDDDDWFILSVAGSCRDASVLRKIHLVLPFKKVGFFFLKLTQRSCDYNGWNAAWMHLFECHLLCGVFPYSFVHPWAFPEYPQHNALSLLHFTKIHNLQVCLLYHIVISWEQGLCLHTLLSPKCSTKSQARFARYLNMNQMLLVLLKRTLC